MSEESSLPQIDLMPDKTFLVVKSKRGKGTKISLENARLFLGRASLETSPDHQDISDFSQRPGEISRRHLEVRWSGRRLEAVDLGSVNHFQHNGQSVLCEPGHIGRAVPLKIHDTIRIVDVEFAIEVEV